MKEETVEKAKKGCFYLLINILLYCAGSAVFLIIAISFATSGVRINGITDVFSTAGRFLIIIPSWILFTAVWILAAVKTRPVFRKLQSMSVSGERISGTHVTRGEFEKIISDGKEKIRMMKKYADETRRPDIKKKILSVAEASAGIYRYLEKEPSSIRQAGLFLNFYNDSALTVIRKYAAVSSGPETEKNIQLCKKVEDGMESIAVSFGRQYEKLIDGSISDIDLELSFLKKTLKNEGF